MATESKMVVYAALAGNVLVAAAKFVAAFISGSSAMLTEAVHSTADTINQVLLLIGDHRAKKPPDVTHPFGYDGEKYFWAFVVGVMVLIAGGGVSIVQGVLELVHPHPVKSPAISLAVLGLSVVFEGSALSFSYRAYRRVVARHPGDGRPVSLWKFIKRSKDPNLYETLLEDSAALIGIAIAAVGIIGNGFLGVPWMDGAASVAIGFLLIAQSYIIAYATRSLIAGESAVAPLRMELVAALESSGFGGDYSDMRTLHIGPDTILVTLPVSVPHGEDAAAVAKRLDTMRDCIKGVDERFRHVFFTLST